VFCAALRSLAGPITLGIDGGGCFGLAGAYANRAATTELRAGRHWRCL